MVPTEKRPQLAEIRAVSVVDGSSLDKAPGKASRGPGHLRMSSSFRLYQRRFARKGAGWCR
jgi:hypothetical protein